jgi:hypothetical protein
MARPLLLVKPRKGEFLKSPSGGASMRFISLPKLFCCLMQCPDELFVFLIDHSAWSDRGECYSLTPELPDGDPLEKPPRLPDFPTDVPVPEPHDVPAWEPVDDPPPEPTEPSPRPIP